MGQRKLYWRVMWDTSVVPRFLVPHMPKFAYPNHLNLDVHEKNFRVLLMLEHTYLEKVLGIFFRLWWDKQMGARHGGFLTLSVRAFPKVRGSRASHCYELSYRLESIHLSALIRAWEFSDWEICLSHLTLHVPSYPKRRYNGTTDNLFRWPIIRD